MKYILTPVEMRKADSEAINHYHVSSAVLMENAARSSAEYIAQILEERKKLNPLILLLCGSGNNGGDGFALARHLFGKYKIKIAWLGNTGKMSPETLANFKSAESIGIDLSHLSTEEDINHFDFTSDCIIDALIGVGGSENIKGLALQILEKINDIKSIKIAIDSPTGLNTETGICHPKCFRADYTVTMFAVKTGMLMNEGIDRCGKIFIARLGAPELIVKEISKNHILEYSDIAKIIPERKKRTSKFDYGRVLVVAGSNNYPGAAALCANAAVTSGAGLVQLFTTFLHPGIFPDVIPHILPATKTGSISLKAVDTILRAAESANVTAIGPGLGNDNETIEVVKALIRNLPDSINILIDADGLRAIDENSILRKNVILTPHTGEFSRLTGIPRSAVEEKGHLLAKEWAERLNCIIHLKHTPSIITNGEKSYWNIYGNPGMATGGSGDVLSGIISALLAQRIEPLEASAAGAFLHSKAGDLYSEQFQQETLTASDLIDILKEIFPKRHS